MKVETLAEQLLFLTLRVETARSVGTGFVVRYRWPDRASGRELTGLFLVSNKHVIRDSTRGTLTVTRKLDDGPDLTLGNHDAIEVDPKLWRGWTHHPSDGIDVAALRLTPILNSLDYDPSSVVLTCLSPEDIPTADTLNHLDVLEEVVFVGYPNNIYDQANNLPIMRKGITATPANVDYNAMPIFLIDASVFPGSSGSPVFVYNAGAWRERSGPVLGSERYVFWGVLAAVLYRQEDGTLEFTDIPTSLIPVVRTREMIDLGIVYKARTVLETIEHGLRRFGEI